MATRLRVALTFMLIPAAAMAFAAHDAIRGSTEAVEKIVQVSAAHKDKAVDLQRHMFQASLLLAEPDGDTDIAEALRREILVIDDAFSDLERIAPLEGVDRQPLLAAQGLWRQVQAAHIKRQFVGAVEAPRIEQSNEFVTQYLREVDRTIGRLRADAIAARVQTQKNAGIILLLGAVLTLAMYHMVAVQAIRPIKRLRHAADQWHGGDLSYRVSGGHDAEVAELADALNAMAAQIEQQHAELKSLSVRDGLTGLYNHRAFHDHLSTLFDRNTEGPRPVSIVGVDVDRFKAVNDQYGHQSGDRALRAVGRAMLTTARTDDFPARLGGDEFAIILPNTDLPGAYFLAERLVKEVERAVEQGEMHNGSDGERLAVPTVSVSVGVATGHADMQSAHRLLLEADSALYAAKRDGRNTIRVAEPASTALL